MAFANSRSENKYTFFVVLILTLYHKSLYLLLVQICIVAILIDKLLVRAILNNFSFFKHNNSVHIFKRWKSMGNHNNGLSFLCSSTFWISSSLSLSSALVASSRRRIGAALRIARAMAIRCLCPPESFTHLSPTFASYFSGSESINSSA